MGRLRESELRLRSVWEEAHRRVLPQLTVDAAYWLGTVLELEGRIVEAEEEVAEAFEKDFRTSEHLYGLFANAGIDKGGFIHEVPLAIGAPFLKGI